MEGGGGETRKQRFNEFVPSGIITEIETYIPYFSSILNKCTKTVHALYFFHARIHIDRKPSFLHSSRPFSFSLFTLLPNLQKLLLLPQQTGCCCAGIIAIDRPRKRIGVAGALVLTVRARNSRDTNSRARV